MTAGMKRTLTQIHAAGFALFGRFGWHVNGWTGSGPLRWGPDKRTMQRLLDDGFLIDAKCPIHGRRFELTVFARAAIDVDGEAITLANGVRGKRYW